MGGEVYFPTHLVISPFDVGDEPRVRVRVRSTEPLSGYYSFQ